MNKSQHPPNRLPSNQMRLKSVATRSMLTVLISMTQKSSMIKLVAIPQTRRGKPWLRNKLKKIIKNNSKPPRL